MTSYSPAEAVEIRAALAKLQTSEVFAHSQRMLRFLEFVVEAALAGQGERLNQTAIGIDVFDRGAGFDPTADSVVRVEAGRLRSKLLEYYVTDGRHDAWKFEIPKGRYAPEITFVASREAVDDSAPTRPAPSVRTDEPPAIVVVPFDNLGGGADIAAFAAGLTEDIMTGLSAYRWCPVIARHSSLNLKDKAADLGAMAEQFGVGYILEGSVRGAGKNLRINVQFIRADGDTHLWAERYDRQLGDVFALQDDVTRRVVTHVAIEFRQAEIDRALKQDPESLGFWGCVNRAAWHVARGNQDDNQRAQHFANRALELKPRSADTLPHLAISHLLERTYGWSDDPEASLNQALTVAQQAVANDPRHSESFACLSACLKELRQHQESVETAKQAVALNPFSHHSRLCLGSALLFAGQPREALEEFRQAMKLSPRSLDRDVMLANMALAHLVLRDFDQAVSMARQAVHAKPTVDRSYYRLAAGLAYRDETEAAAKVLADARALGMEPSVRYLSILHPFQDPAHFEFILEGLRKAGWTEA
ncbi:MAG: hypothetical protein JSV45_08000 [Chromatiales bacterium]|nr:MAG: hypothetical protein JSV45_08000 [Chromatiales bacterium]